MRLTAALCALAFVATAAHAAPQIGPLRVGMSEAELRAAAPQAQWNENVAALTRGRAMQATKALTIGSFVFDVDSQTGDYGAAKLTLAGQAPAKNRKECRDQTQALLTAIEPGLGAIKTPQPYAPLARRFVPGGVHTTRIDGNLVVMPTPGYYVGPTERILQAGAASEVRMIEDGKSMKWTGELSSPGDAHVSAHGAYDYSGGRACTADFELRFTPPPPKPEYIAFEKLMLISGPTPAQLHYSIEGVDLPAKGVTVTGDCEISRSSGRVMGCTFEPRPAEALVQAAVQRASRMAFDNNAFSATNPAPLFAKIPFKLSPADRMKNPPPKTIDVATLPLVRPMPPVVAPPPTSAALIHRPTTAELYQYYPRKALKAEIETDVRLSCIVNADQSAACDKFTVLNQGLTADTRRDFETAAAGVSKLVRFSSTLRNGAPSAGTRQDFIVSFRIP